MSDAPPITTGLGVQIVHEKRPTPIKPPPADMWQGFGVLDRGGNLAWGTIRPTEAESRAMWEKWNPPIKGHPMGERIIKVRINIENLPLQRDLL